MMILSSILDLLKLMCYKLTQGTHSSYPTSFIHTIFAHAKLGLKSPIYHSISDEWIYMTFYLQEQQEKMFKVSTGVNPGQDKPLQTHVLLQSVDDMCYW